MNAPTPASVEKFQKAHGLTVDGIVGPKTWNKIKADKKFKSHKPKKKTTAAKAPSFPWKAGHYIGPKSGPAHSHSGAVASDRPHIKTAQNQLINRGWTGVGKADGYYGPKLKKVVRQFQAEKRLSVDGLIGAKTWAALWEEPVT